MNKIKVLEKQGAKKLIHAAERELKHHKDMFGYLTMQDLKRLYEEIFGEEDDQ